MNWLYSRKTIQSEKNGRIDVARIFGRTTVYAGGFEQSGPYVEGLWKRALQEIPQQVEVKNVLMLGLGGGSALRLLNKAYPHARIVVVEWDPVMLHIAKELHMYSREPSIIEGDILTIIPVLVESFDLVLGDVFFGDKPDAGLMDKQVGAGLNRILTEQGICMVNISRNPMIIDALRGRLAFVKTIPYRVNTVALFRKLESV